MQPASLPKGSRAGSGKTGAFGLPTLQVVHETLRGKCTTARVNASTLKCEFNLNDKDMSTVVQGVRRAVRDVFRCF